MAVRGLRSRIDELSSALGSQEMPADQKQKLQDYESEAAGAQQRIYELQADLKRGAEKIGETEIRAAKKEREAKETYADRVRAEYARPDYDTMVAEFRPTKTQGSDIMGLFAMLSAVAYMSGGKGRYAGEAAMKNAGSMLEGWNKGREDLFKRELLEFDKNLKTVDQHNKASEAKLKKAIELFSVDRDAAMGLVAEIKAENVGTKAQQELNQGLMTQALNTFKEARAGSEKVRNNWNTIVENAWKEQQKDQRDFAMKMIEAGRAKELLLGNDDNLYVFRNDGSITDTHGNKPPEGVKFSQFKKTGDKGGGKGSATSQQFENITSADIGNAWFRINQWLSRAKSVDDIPSGSPFLRDRGTQSGIVDAFLNYAKTSSLPADMQATDAALLGIAFDIVAARAQGRSTGVTDAKIAQVVRQLPIEGDRPETKREKVALLFNQLDEVNKMLPGEKQKSGDDYMRSPVARQIWQKYSGEETSAPQVPQPGEVKGGYRFKGGNPADKNNWEKVSG
ncbi:MAG: hypothetical protein EBR82_47120 [Caulobacteraceae bacterium]|nr:hypothetical protein [Caulobacteraceae bacterium]